MRVRTSVAVLPESAQLVKLVDPLMYAPPPCMQKYAISRVTFQRGDGRRLQRVQMRAPTKSCVLQQRKVSEFNGALEEGSGRFKMRALTPWGKTAQSVKVQRGDG